MCEALLRIRNSSIIIINYNIMYIYSIPVEYCFPCLSFGEEKGVLESSESDHSTASFTLNALKLNYSIHRNFRQEKFLPILPSALGGILSCEFFCPV